MADRVETLGDEAGEIGLPRPEDLRHRLHASGEFGRGPRQGGHLEVELRLPVFGSLAVLAASAGRAHERDQQAENEQRRGRHSGDREVKYRDRHAAGQEKGLVHRLRVADSPLLVNE